MSIFTEPTYVKVPDSSTFDLSRENKTTLPMGKLVPVFVQECVPKDHFSVNANVFVRTLAMIAPAYQRYDLSLHFFFVPYRLLWKNWEDFITGGKDGTFDAEVPTLAYTTRAFDMLGSFGPRPQSVYNLPPLSSSDYTIDQLEALWNSNSTSLADFCSIACGSIYDYLGYPMPHYHTQNITITSTSGGSTATRDITVLMPDNIPMAYDEDMNSGNLLSSFRLSAYCLIFKEWYKDENYDFTLSDIQRYNVSNYYNSAPLQQSYQTNFINWLNDVNQPFGYGYDDDGFKVDWLSCASLFPRSWRKDYFTSALPWAQRGDVASVVTTGRFIAPVTVRGLNPDMAFVKRDGSSPDDGALSVDDGYITDTEGYGLHPSNLAVNQLLSSVFNVNDVRRMFAVQSWLERNARGGSRYVEQIMAHFGVRVPDARLMRSEYLGGFSQPIQISSVEQTGTYSDMDNVKQPLGNLAGRGTSANSGHCFDYSVLEHGVILGIASVLPRASYQQGCSRFLTKFDKFDFYFPSFAHLGEQEILNQELFMNFGCGENQAVSSGLNKGTFGYQMRYAEYKCANDEIHGDMLQTQDFWHDGRIFAPLTDSDDLTYHRPALNQDFVLSRPSLRPFAVEPERHLGAFDSSPVEDVHVLFGDFGFDVKARRPMPRFAEPKLVG